MSHENPPEELRSTGYEIFIGLLSLLTLVNLALGLAVRGDEDLHTILLAVDIGISAIFLVDFLFRLSKAGSKREYLFHQYGWADLLSAIPLGEVKALRLLRLIRVVQMFRRFGLRSIGSSLRRVRADNTLLTAAFGSILLIEFGSLQILAAERRSPEGNIESASDALWYTLVTISTVGYGDHFPTTRTGRLIGTLLIVVGIGLFASLAGFLTDKFLSPGLARRSTGTSAITDRGQASGELRRGASDGQEAARLEAIRAALDRPGVTVEEIADLASGGEGTGPSR